MPGGKVFDEARDRHTRIFLDNPTRSARRFSPFCASQALSPKQLAALNAPSAAALTVEQLAGLSAEQKAALPPAALAVLLKANPKALGAVDAQLLAQLRPDQVAAVIAAGAVGSLPAEALKKLTAEHLQPSTLKALTKSQLLALDPKQLAAFTAEQLGVIASAVIPSMSAEVLAKLSPNAMSAVPAATLKALKPEQASSKEMLRGVRASSGPRPAWWHILCKALQPLVASSCAPYPSLTALDVPCLQLAALTPAQLQGLTPTQVSALRPGQLANLTGAQVAGISLQCLRLFTEEQKEALGQAKLRLVGTLPRPGGWVLDMPWRQRFEWAPKVETEVLPARGRKPSYADPREGTAEEVEDHEDLVVVLVDEPGEERFWHAADVAVMMVMDEEDWGEEDSRCNDAGAVSSFSLPCRVTGLGSPFSYSQTYAGVPV